MIRAHAVYEGIYLLGTSIARPLIAKRQIAIAKKFGAYAVSHGATGKGNDQVRFELGYAYFGKKIAVIAPWREWNLQSRTDLINYAKKNHIPIPKDKKGAPPFSVDDNIFHTSTEGKVLENPKNSAPEFIFQRTVSPEKASNKKTKIKISFKNGDPIAINNKKLNPENLLRKLNLLGGKNGIGRVDLVENRFIGIKSRGVYETPGLIFKPLGSTPIEITFAPKSNRSFGADLYPAPLAQSITIFIRFKLKFLGKFFLRIFMYFSLAFSILFTLPKFFGLDK